MSYSVCFVRCKLPNPNNTEYKVRLKVGQIRRFFRDWCAIATRFIVTQSVLITKYATKVIDYGSR